jgi:hypothetical protein
MGRRTSGLGPLLCHFRIKLLGTSPLRDPWALRGLDDFIMRPLFRGRAEVFERSTVAECPIEIPRLVQSCLTSPNVNTAHYKRLTSESGQETHHRARTHPLEERCHIKTVETTTGCFRNVGMSEYRSLAVAIFRHRLRPRIRSKCIMQEKIEVEDNKMSATVALCPDS